MKLAAIVAVSLGTAGTVALAAAGGWFIRSFGPGGDGVLARFEAPSGETFLVLQRWQCWGEPYVVSLFVHTPEGRWGWCYVDHQSLRLNDVVITPSDDGKVVTIRSRARHLVEYDILNSTVSLLDDSGLARRTLPAPQEWEDPPAQYLR